MEKQQREQNEKVTIEGRNPVIEALACNRPIDKIWISETVRHGGIKKLLDLAKEKGVPVQMVKPQKIDSLKKTEASQGVIALCSATAYATIDALFEKAAEKGEPPFFILADEITDPHNLGAIIRTANAVGAHGVIVPKNRSAGLDAVVAKTSAGAVHYTPVARVTNLSRTIEELKERGLWLAGADMSGKETLFQSDMKGAICLVVGSEGKGISRLVKEQCDFMVKIPMVGQIESLNASVAAAIMMYEVYRQRTENK